VTPTSSWAAYFVVLRGGYEASWLPLVGFVLGVVLLLVLTWFWRNDAGSG